VLLSLAVVQYFVSRVGYLLFESFFLYPTLIKSQGLNEAAKQEQSGGGDPLGRFPHDASEFNMVRGEEGRAKPVTRLG